MLEVFPLSPARMRNVAVRRRALNANASLLAVAQQPGGLCCFPHCVRPCAFTGDFEMRVAPLAILALALPAMMGCAGDKTNKTAAWRHSDGSELSAVELAKGRAACQRT